MTFYVTKELALYFTSIALVVFALVSRFLVTRKARKRHLELSSEQLDLLRMNQRQFVSARFRTLIIEWRNEDEVT